MAWDTSSSAFLVPGIMKEAKLIYQRITLANTKSQPTVEWNIAAAQHSTINQEAKWETPLYHCEWMGIYEKGYANIFWKWNQVAAKESVYG